MIRTPKYLVLIMLVVVFPMLLSGCTSTPKVSESTTLKNIESPEPTKALLMANERIVVERVSISERRTTISLSDALKLNPEAKVGDIITIPATPTATRAPTPVPFTVMRCGDLKSDIIGLGQQEVDPYVMISMVEEISHDYDTLNCRGVVETRSGEKFLVSFYQKRNGEYGTGPLSISNTLCRYLVPNIIELSEDKILSILKIYDPEELHRTDDRLDCIGSAITSGGEFGIEFYTKDDRDSDRFIGYDFSVIESSQADPTPYPAQTPKQPVAEGTLSAVDLVEEFINNAVAATQKYSGLDLVVEGEVTAIDYNIWGEPYAAVGSGSLLEFQTVWCMVSDVSDVAGFSVGDKVTVEGTFFVWDTFYVLLSPCSPQVNGSTAQPAQTPAQPTQTPDPYVASSNGLRLLEWETYEDDWGNNYISGVIENPSKTYRSESAEVCLYFDLYDSAGYFVGDEMVLISDSIPPSQQLKFDEMIFNDSFSRLEFKAFKSCW